MRMSGVGWYDAVQLQLLYLTLASSINTILLQNNLVKRLPGLEKESF